MMPELSNNQKAIRVVKAESNAHNPYSIFNYAALREAMKLPNAAFKIWAYLNAHSNGHEFGLSSKEVCEVCKISRNTYDKAIQVLISEGYLVRVELYPNLTGYLFVERKFSGET